MTRTSPATDHWSVTTRTQGGVQSALASLPSIEMALLGIPEGFTAGEIQSWLRDLAGVAIETSRTDERTRPIPQLLHHVLTGLLFSQTELWSHTGQALPCAAVFVETPQGTAFGWVGRARVVLLVNGEPFEPQWVIVRDEAGQEAMSAMLPAGSHVLLTLEYWPHSAGGQQAPASVDAEYGQSLANRVPSPAEPGRAGATPASTPLPTMSPMPATPNATAVPAATPLPLPVAGAQVAPPITAGEPLASAAASAVSPSPAPSQGKPPTDQPGLAPDPSRALSLDQPDHTQSLPSTYHASSSTFTMPSVPSAGRPVESHGEPLTDVPRPETELTRGAHPSARGAEPEAGHPVGRWLTRLMDFAKKAMPAQEASQGPFASAPARVPHRAPQQQASNAPASAEPAAPTLPVQRPTLSVPVLSTPTLPATPPVVARASEPPANIAPNAANVQHATNEPVRIDPAQLTSPIAPPPSAQPPSAQPPSAQQPIAQPPIAQPPIAQRPPAPPAKSGLLAVGLRDILGSRTSPPPPKPAVPPLEGLTTLSTPAAPELPPQPERPLVSPDALAPGQAPYPTLRVTPPRQGPPPRGPIQIEREPVGASAEFAIPKLPPLEAPKPFRVPVPTAADAVKPAAPPTPPAPAAPAAPTARVSSPPPVVRPPGAPPPASAVPRAPEATRPPVPPGPAARPPVASAPPSASPSSPSQATATPKPGAGAIPTKGSTPIMPHVPEPPADFLAEFAASLGADIKPLESSPSTETRRPAPPLPSVRRAVANVPPPAAAAPSATFPAIAPLPAPEAVAPPENAVVPPVLRSPSAAAPIPVSQSELSEILRELPLPPREQPADTDVPDGMLVATPISNVRSRRGSWPAADDLEPTRAPLWRNPWLIGAFVAVLFGVGWLVGHAQAPDNDVNATPLSRMLRAVGLAGARFTAAVDSDPPGAIISVDGKEIGRRTPATIDLVPGTHKITLSMPDLGQVDVDLKGSRGQQLKVNEALHGALEVTALDKSLPVKVSLDGEPMGFLPLSVEKLPPGLHEVQFSGPNMQPWAQNVSVPIRGTATVKARPMMSPATGVVQVQAILNDEGGSTPLSGASVFVDGELRGSTPETMELPRGPHSIKVTYRGTAAPVQVIDLPGGNKRFAQFQFGLDSDLPPLKLQGDYSSFAGKKQTIVEATLDGLDWHDVREAWLHVRTSEGVWRRYQVTIGEGMRGTLLSAQFPHGVGDAGGRVHWYMSAATTQGDDFYTEMQRSAR